MGLLNNFLDAISYKADKVREVPKDGKGKSKKGYVSMSGSQKLAPPTLNQEAAPKAPALEDFFASITDLTEPIQDVVSLRQVPVGYVEKEVLDQARIIKIFL
uniref:Uncharacterized protein n=1 Tax=Cannabis sativa TaxID=3483 RepID=A0A803PJG5_CANSA